MLSLLASKYLNCWNDHLSSNELPLISFLFKIFFYSIFYSLSLIIFFLLFHNAIFTESTFVAYFTMKIH